MSVNSGFQVLRLTGDPAKQRAKLRPRRVGGAAADRGRLPVAASCAQPCRMKIRIEVGGRAGSARVLALPLHGKRTVRVRLSRGQRRLLERSGEAQVRAVAVVRDRLTGERQLRVRSPAADRVHRWAEAADRGSRRATGRRPGASTP